MLCSGTGRFGFTGVCRAPRLCLDGEMPLTETNQTTARVNLYGNGLVMSGGETLMGDGLGATRQTTNSAQNVQWSSGYTAFGQSVSPSGSTNSHYGWGAGSGYRSDNFGPTYAASVMKVGCRYYDPEFGCFLTRDTDLNESPYGYCDGDPVNFSDPSGHAKKAPPKPGQPTNGTPTPKGPGAPGSAGGGGSGGAPGQAKPEPVPGFVPSKVTFEISGDAKAVGLKASVEFDGPALWKLMSPTARAGIHNTTEFTVWVFDHEVL